MMTLDQALAAAAEAHRRALLAEEARGERDEAILQAVAHGATTYGIAKHLGLTRQAVDFIVQRGKPKTT